MKRYLLTIFFCLLASKLFGLTLTLKEQIVTGTNEITLESVVEENIDSSFGEIVIMVLRKPKVMITSLEILDVLYQNDIRSVNLVGYGTIIMTEEYAKSVSTARKQPAEKERPRGALAFLEDHFLSYLDSSTFSLEIKVRSVSPEVSLDDISDNYTWEFKKLAYGLKDMEGRKELVLLHEGRRHRVQFDIHIYASVWLTAHNVRKGLLFHPDYFYKKSVDISTFKDMDNLVFDINKVKNSKITNTLGTGYVLRWPDIEKIPVLVNGEQTDIKMVNDSFSITLKGWAMQKGFLNEKIKVKLENGNILHGVVKSLGEDYYVEIM